MKASTIDIPINPMTISQLAKEKCTLLNRNCKRAIPIPKSTDNFNAIFQKLEIVNPMKTLTSKAASFLLQIPRDKTKDTNFHQ